MSPHFHGPIQFYKLYQHTFLKKLYKKNPQVHHVLAEYYEKQTTISGALNYVVSPSGTHTFL